MKTKLTPEYIASKEFQTEISKVPKIVKKYLTNGQYFNVASAKTCIFLHHTAGTTAQGAWGWWNQTPDRVGTPYLIDRDGTIFECFDPKAWAWHLGIKGDDDSQEKASIGIEIVSAGALRGKDGDTFMPLFPNAAGSIKMNPDSICKLSKPWRGESSYHAYSDEQIIALCQLLGKLKTEFKTIPFPKSFGISDMEYNADVIAKDLKGLFAHTTVRKDKNDIFPQPNLLEAINKFLSLK